MLEKPSAKLYERDLILWIGAQVEALRVARWQELDLSNVAAPTQFEIPATKAHVVVE